ncbi:MAG: hypothetical protein CMJ71_03615 [Planctomycetaceae bacterium]|nr:hypothetical protein [Planctomycetaceae bacterium]
MFHGQRIAGTRGGVKRSFSWPALYGEKPVFRQTRWSDEDRRLPQFLKNLTAKTFDWCSDPSKPVGD